MTLLPIGMPAPPFSLTAVTSERMISPQRVLAPLLLIFHSYQTASILGPIIQAAREVYPSSDEVLIASVADMRIVPRLLRKTATKMMQNAYKDASSKVPVGQKPADHIIILPDWNGIVFEAYQVPDTSRQVAMVLINQSKVIQGDYLGSQPQKAVIALLAENNM